MSPEKIATAAQRLPRPVADDARRQSTRNAFVAGTLAERTVPSARPQMLVWSSRLLPLLAAAAALIAVTVLNAGPAWQVRALTGATSLRVDGHELTDLTAGGLARQLHNGVRVELPAGAQLDLELPGIALFQLVGGSDVTLGRSPGRWFAREMSASLQTGELRVTTAASFHGARLAVWTPQARALVSGTTLAVLSSPDSSCVCVFEGAVAMRDGAGVSQSVRAGTRRSVYRDGRAPFVEPILPMETMKLQMLQAQAGDSSRR